MENCLVVCPESLKGVPRGLTAAASESYVIGVDGGLDHLRKLKLYPNVWVGDADSVKSFPRNPEFAVGKLPKDKDYSDLDAALEVAGHAFFEGGWTGDLFLIGAQGGRFDHDIVNLLSVQRWLNRMLEAVGRAKCPDVISYGVNGMWLATVRGMAFTQPKGRLFSVCAFESGAKISLTGAKFNARKKALEPGSLGLSNVGTGKLVKLAVHGGKTAVFVLFPNKS